MSKDIKDVDLVVEDTIRKYKTIKNESDKIKDSISLIYPSYSKNSKKKSDDVRISEQEFKTLFCAELINNKIPFSVETPTSEKYSFKNKNHQGGKKTQSGNIDVCVYDFDENKKEYKRTSNIELKAHNSGNYQRDFEKLIREIGDNYFIHVLKSMNNGTLYYEKSSKRKAVINKYIDAIKDIYSKKNYTKLTFYIYVLKQSVLLKNTIDCKDNIEEIKKKLTLNYKCSKKDVFSLIGESNWKICFKD